MIRSVLYTPGNGKNTTQFRFKKNQLSPQLFQFSNVIRYECENVNFISFTHCFHANMKHPHGYLHWW